MKKSAINVTTLSNGVVIASENIPTARSASAGLWLEVGSGTEDQNYNGISHFFEHIVFKGTTQRSALQIAREIEDRGGRINAFTSREYTCFYSRVIREDLPLAIDTICDLVNNPLITEKDVARERKVINEEIRSYADSPEELAYDAFTLNLFNKTGLGLPIAGTLSSVKKIGVEQLRAHHHHILTHTPIWLVVAGKVDHNWLVEQAERLLTAKISTDVSKIPQNLPGLGQGAKQLRRDIQQSSIVVGASQPFVATPTTRHAMGLFNSMFGGVTSSRLFQNIREKHGLAYSVYSSVDNYKNSRTFTINLGTAPKNHEKVVKLLRREIDAVRTQGFSQDELDRAINASLGSVKLKWDSPAYHMDRLARQLIRSGTWQTLGEVERELKRIKLKDIEQTVAELFANENWMAAAVIPQDSQRIDFKPLLSFS